MMILTHRGDPRMPSAAKVRCPGCQTVLRIPADGLERPIRCHQCSKQFRVTPKAKAVTPRPAPAVTPKAPAPPSPRTPAPAPPPAPATVAPPAPATGGNAFAFDDPAGGVVSPV